MADEATYFRHGREEVATLLPARPTEPGRAPRFLEIGCGEGAFARHVAAPREYWGIEPSADAARVAERDLDRVLTGTYRDAHERLPDDYFDCIVCNDVIEHMDDHDWFLEAIKSKMRDGAAIVGSIPNVRHISNMIRLVALRDWQYEESGILDRTHLRFFTEKSLKRTLEAHGYVVEAFRGVNASTMAKAASAKDKAIEAGKGALIRLAGGDTRYPQFAFRVRRPAAATT